MITFPLKKSFLGWCVVIFLTTSSSFANSGLAFLEIGGGARATGMGEAFTAMSNDPTCVFWNPAGVADMTVRKVHFTHNEWLQDITNEFVSIVFPTTKGNLGLSLILSNVGGIERRTKASIEPLAEFSAHDLAVGLTFARPVGNSMMLGITGKFVYEKIYIQSASGYAIDAGLRYITPLDGVSLGAAVQNFGKTNQLKEEEISLPTKFSFGIAYSLPSNLVGGNFVATTDVVKMFDEDMHFQFGGEYQVLGRAIFRAGYLSGFEEKGLTAGFGVGAGKFLFDYAFVPFGSDLGSTHRFSLEIDF